MSPRRQQELKGLERPSIKELDDAAEAYQAEKVKRMRMTEKEVEAKDKLVEVMTKHKLSIYKDDNAVPPLIVTLTPGKVKIKVTQEETDEEAADELEG